MPIVKVVKKELPEAAVKFAELIEKYKVQNPVKYALKKAELERKLAELK